MLMVRRLGSLDQKNRIYSIVVVFLQTRLQHGVLVDYVNISRQQFQDQRAVCRGHHINI